MYIKLNNLKSIINWKLLFFLSSFIVIFFVLNYLLDFSHLIFGLPSTSIHCIGTVIEIFIISICFTAIFILTVLESKKRKLADKTLQETREIFQSISTLSQDAIIIMDNEGYISFWNKGAENIFGCTKEETIGCKFLEFISQDINNNDYRKIFKKYNNIGNFSTFDKTLELTGIRKDGSKFPIELSLSSLKLNNKWNETAIIRDLTKRKEIEEALQESEENYRFLFNRLGEGVGIVDLNETFILANPAAESLFGVEPGDLNGRNLKEFVDPESFVKIQKETNSRKKGKSSTYDLKIMHPNGEERYIIVTATPKYNKDLNISGTLGIFRDITLRLQADKKIRESEEKFRAISESAIDSIFIKDINLKYINVNPAMERLFGLPSSKLIGKTDIELFGEETGNYLIEKDKKVIEGEILIYEHEKAVRGKLYSFHTIKVPLKNSEGKIIGLCGISRDITERKQAENIQKALYNISNALNTTGKMQYFYNKIREYLGNVIDTTNFYVALYDKDNDLISFDYYIDEFVKDKDTIVYRKLGKGLTDYVIRTVKPLLATEKVLEKLVHSGEVEMIGAPSKIWIGIPLKIENKVIGVIAVQSYDNPNLYSEKDIDILTFVSEEITLAIKHKQADENIQKAHEELKELHENLQKKVDRNVVELREKDHILIQQSRQAAMGEMIGNIAHQWRQPLQAIAGIIQNYEDAFEDGTLDMDYIEKHTDLIMDILTNMSRTIDDFRYFFKPNKLKKNFNIKNIILKTIAFLESSFKFNNIDVSFDLEDNCIIEGFPNEYSQVLLVILSNAKDELVERKIKDKKISIVLKRIEDKFVLKISDNAGGITKEVLPKVFDPYFTTKEQGKGTGIGLYMAKMIIEKNMEGKLTARNIKDGVEFRIEV